MDLTFDFRPLQIVYLEHAGTRLYAEVIQVVDSRQVCWVRPLMLSVSSADSQPSDESPPIYDLRSSSDLLWPVHLFRPALDTELLPLMTQLLASDQQPEYDPATKQQLNHFIHQVWRQNV